MKNGGNAGNFFTAHESFQNLPKRFRCSTGIC